MSVRVVPKGNGSWEADIRLRLPNGQRHRDRKILRKISKSAAQRWAEDRQRHLLQHGPEQPKKEVPTLEDFGARFLDDARANRQKASGFAAKALILRVHLNPWLGQRRLDTITNEDVQRLKAHLGNRSPKTVNNILTVLNTLLRKAVEWDVMEQMPCAVRLLKINKPSVAFYDFEDYERLVESAKAVSKEAQLIVLLGGEAGLRSGEMVALEWGDIDFKRRLLTVQRNVWEGQVDTPKGGRNRFVPLTSRLEAALRAARHLRGPRVLYRQDGEAFSEMSITSEGGRAAHRAGVPWNGPHRLRHTFCSHLAMRGAAPRAIQELAGHASITTTQRYLHLSPAARESAINLLEPSAVLPSRGEMGDAAGI